MRSIDLANENPTLAQIMRMASQEVIILKDRIGQTFVVSQIDDFESEVQLLKNNTEFMQFLQELSQEEATISLAELSQELGL